MPNCFVHDMMGVGVKIRTVWFFLRSVWCASSSPFHCVRSSLFSSHIGPTRRRRKRCRYFLGQPCLKSQAAHVSPAADGGGRADRCRLRQLRGFRFIHRGGEIRGIDRPRIADCEARLPLCRLVAEAPLEHPASTAPGSTGGAGLSFYLSGTRGIRSATAVVSAAGGVNASRSRSLVALPRTNHSHD